MTKIPTYEALFIPPICILSESMSSDVPKSSHLEGGESKEQERNQRVPFRGAKGAFCTHHMHLTSRRPANRQFSLPAAPPARVETIERPWSWRCRPADEPTATECPSEGRLASLARGCRPAQASTTETALLG